MRPRALSSPPKIRAASPLRPAYFDPWNSVSRGHQRADNALSGSVGWRETREMKLKAQFAEGLSGSGGERMYDLVGRGASDEGLAWFVAREGIDNVKENQRLNMSGEIDKTAKGGEEKVSRASDVKRGAPMPSRKRERERGRGEDMGGWDGKVREEKICFDVKNKSGKRRREDDEEEDGVVKKSRTSGKRGRATLDTAADDKIEETNDMDDIKACISAAKDDDNVWGDDEQSTTSNDGHIRLTTSSGTADLAARSLSKKLPSSPTTQHADLQRTARQSTPPSGQTRYASPSPPPSPPTQHKTSHTAKQALHSNVVQQTTTSVILQRPKPIFAGLTVHVSGPTLPLISDHALRGLLIQHGATLVMHLARRRITHVVLGQPATASSDDNERFTGAGATFSARKLQQEMNRIRSATGGPGIRFVSVEWVLDSIKAGVRLSEARFGIGMEQTENANQNQSGPLSKEEREAIGSEVATSGQKRRLDRRAARAREMGNGKAANNAFQKGLARQTAAMPGAPPGVPSVRSLFLKQHRDNAWTKAGFVMKK